MLTYITCPILRIYASNTMSSRASRSWLKPGFALLSSRTNPALPGDVLHKALLRKIHEGIDTLLEGDQIKIDKYFVCPHHPDDNCVCRKPKTGLAQQAQEAFNIDFSSAWMIGDKACDMDLGRAMTARTILVRTGYGRKTEAEALCQPDIICDTLLEAAEYIMAHEATPKHGFFGPILILLKRRAFILEVV